ncbi:hypothetical protein [Portibacter marinus]|uniref:hypothetical protein n=1 Tax=Portibacter marinus TaxID=2898660 RepID=UPI001F3B59BE|nr:hypothetical protein [Portibacter marinus]
MKSIIKSLIVLLVVFSASNDSFASIYPTIKLVEKKTLAVNLNDWANTNVNITIKDTYGNILHMDKIQ